jgi:hemerythrin
MASLVWNNKLNPTVDLMNIYFNKIDECVKYINEDILDTNCGCEHTGDLINQLGQLYQLQFMYEEQLLEGLSYPLVDSQKDFHKSFLRTFENFKQKSDQCHSQTFINDFNLLRLDLVSKMNNETMKLCDFIINSYC